MTRDDIIRMAREACAPDTADAWHNGFWTLTQPELERFAQKVTDVEHNALRDAAEWALEALTQASVLCAEGTSTRRSVDAAMNALREALGDEK